jgi:methylmalonyl-CoA mutase N-terminal domain/subunit
VSHEVERGQVAALAARRASRDGRAVRTALDGLLAAARSGANTIPAMLDAVRAEATLGEICDLLRAEWGEHVEPARL